MDIRLSCVISMKGLINSFYHKTAAGAHILFTGPF